MRKTILRAKRNTRRGGEMNILRAGALDLCLWSLRERYKEKSPESISINPRPTLTHHNVKLASYPPRGKEEGMMPNKRSLLKLVVICATVISLAWITRSTLCELRIRSGTTEVAAILAYESER